MSENDNEEVGLPPTFKNSLKQILAHAASQERTVVEFRTVETEAGGKHLAHALDITEHVGKLEEQVGEVPDRA